MWSQNNMLYHRALLLWEAESPYNQEPTRCLPPDLSRTQGFNGFIYGEWYVMVTCRSGVSSRVISSAIFNDTVWKVNISYEFLILKKPLKKFYHIFVVSTPVGSLSLVDIWTWSVCTNGWNLWCWFFCCQPDEPLAFLVTTKRIINVYGFLVGIMLLMYSVLLCLYSVGNEITTTDCFHYNHVAKN